MNGSNDPADDETDSDDEGQTIDGATGLPEPGAARIKLSTLRDIRLEMARVYRKVKRGALDDGLGSKRIYMLGEIGKIIRDAELEQRIIELEARHALGNDGRPLLPMQRKAH